MTEETTKSLWEKRLDQATCLVAILMSVYHLVAANYTLVYQEQHINIHLVFALVIVFLQAVKFKKGKPTDRKSTRLNSSHWS